MALALALVAVATLIPIPHGNGGDDIPFWCLGCGDYALADAVANVVLFVPLGWAMSRTGVRTWLALAAVLATTSTVESLQYGFIAGRVASIQDILTNTLGGAVGMALPGVWARAVDAPVRASIVYGLLLAGCLGVSTALQAVSPARTLYWTEGVADLTHYVPFTGSVRTVRVDGAPITMHEWLDMPAEKVVEIAVDLVSGRPDTGLAHVVIAWMPSGSGWMWLEQRDRDLHLHLTSASDRWRLRGHSVWLRQSMPAMAGEPVSVRLVVRPFSYRIILVTNGGTLVREADIGPGDGWRLFAPGTREWGLRTTLFTAAWMAALVGPLGYLASVRSRAAVGVAAMSATAALCLLPIVAGCAWPPLPGWCGAASGVLVGSLSRALVERFALRG
ncbi:MAG TPA: VanZ family protein [Gemmatimonadales bacterium]|nr:VanZ family protein [Gemmatimonadales bacterium]